jgi:acetolactate synthase-1/2/3 large subunit
MNLQELQTVVHNKLKIKLIVFNNFSYQAILRTQNNFFKGRLSGCTEASGISFPDFEKLAYAYDIPYLKIETNDAVDDGLKWLLSQDSYALCEVIQDLSQPIEPKVMSKELPDGTLVSPAIDDLAPFLDSGIYKKYRDRFNAEDE